MSLTAVVNQSIAIPFTLLDDLGDPETGKVNALNSTVINFGTSFPLPATLTKASAAGDTPCIWMRGS